MFKIVLLVLSFSMSLRAVSQQDYFVYLQSEDRQPFYAKLSGQVHSSSENGYLIIPKVVDGSYQLDIGFARSAFPEQHFQLSVNKKDLGFQIKNLGDKGWALYNFKNSELLASSNTVGQKSEDFAGAKKTDMFSEMLASIVNDSAILYSAVKPTPPPKPVVKESKPDSSTISKAAEKEVVAANTQPAKQDQVQPPLKRDSVLIKPDTVAALLAKVDPPKAVDPVVVKPAEEVKTNPAQPAISSPATKEKPFIIRINESTSATGYEAMYLEQYNLSTDTIKISIPLQESEKAGVKKTPENVKQIVSPELQPQTQTQPQTQPPVVTGETTVTAPVVKQQDAPTPPKKSTLQIVNSDCKNFATDFDVDKLRVKMMTEYAIEDKLVAAKKVFKTRCFTVKQIKALTELFTTDETRYQFFDAAYPFVSDTSEFQTLESLINNDYYKNRFRAMVHK